MSTKNKFFRFCNNYWSSMETNIFRDYIDAFGGLVVLVVLPAVSVVSVLFSKSCGWSAYTFPVLAICLSGIYDCIGRYNKKSKAKAKLCTRCILDIVAAFIAAVVTFREFGGLSIVAPVVLFISGLIVTEEVFTRIKVGIEISPWYSA